MQEILPVAGGLGGIFLRVNGVAVDEHMEDGWRPVEGDAGLILDIGGLFTQINFFDPVDQGELHHPARAFDEGISHAGYHPLLIIRDFPNGVGKPYGPPQESKKEHAEESK